MLGNVLAEQEIHKIDNLTFFYKIMNNFCLKIYLIGSIGQNIQQDIGYRTRQTCIPVILILNVIGRYCFADKIIRLSGRFSIRLSDNFYPMKNFYPIIRLFLSVENQVYTDKKYYLYNITDVGNLCYD